MGIPRIRFRRMSEETTTTRSTNEKLAASGLQALRARAQEPGRTEVSTRRPAAGTVQHTVATRGQLAVAKFRGV